MPIDLGQFKKKKPEVKIPEVKSTEVKSISIPEKIERKEKRETISAIKINNQSVDNKINEIVNERLLKLVNIGLKHELSIENMMFYFKQVKKTKLYELRRYFSDSSSYEIEKMLKYLYKTRVISRDKDNWYTLRRESINEI